VLVLSMKMQSGEQLDRVLAALDTIESNDAADQHSEEGIMPGLTLRTNQPQDLRPGLRRRPGADRLAGCPLRKWCGSWAMLPAWTAHWRHGRSSTINPTLRLPFFARPNEKDLAEAKSLIFLVARGGIEPPTQGFSILPPKG
jgi:hypothetical protein